MSGGSEWEAEAEHFRKHGFAVIRGLLSREEVDLLQTECSRLLEIAMEKGSGSPEWMARERGCILQPVPAAPSDPQDGKSSHRINMDDFARLRGKWPCEAGACGLLLGRRLSRLGAAMLGAPAWLYNDQYIVKPAGSKLAVFEWHRDSDWCCSESFEYHPYVSIWCALDKMSKANGTLVIRPLGIGEDLVGTATGHQTMNVDAGDAVVMSDKVFHSSGPNRTRFTRAAWMPQFSSGPISHKGSGAPVSLAFRV